MNADPADYYGYTRPELARLLPGQYTRVLEIGCSRGNFRDNLDSPCEYWGIEPEPAAAVAAAEKLDRVLTGLYDEVCGELPDHYFDLVICNDVIEHMPDHDAFLQAIQEKMTPGARLVGSVPNVRFLENLTELIFQKDWRYRDEGILDRTHLRFFTRRSLQRSLQQNGFEIEQLEGINSLLKKRISLNAFKRHLLVAMLGRDTQYLQFGIRVSRKNDGRR